MSESICLRGLRGFVSVVCVMLCVTVAGSAFAQSYRHAVLIDSDNDAATGCTVSSAAGSVSGIELRLDADVSGLPPQVTAVSRSECSGASFAAPMAQGGGYPVALDGGIGGADAIELAMAFADVPNPGPTWRIALLSESDSGADMLGPFTAAGLGNAPPPLPNAAPELIPTMSPGGIVGLSVAMALLLLWGARRHRGLLSVLMICGSLSFVGVAWAAHFIADGNLGDWVGETPNATDPSGDATSGEMPIDIVAGFVRREGSNLFFRIDVSDAESTNRTPAIADQSFSIDEDAANGAAVGAVLASDPDAGDTLSYSITAGNAAGIFAIDAGTGAITIADNSALDFESSTSHALTVSVTDNGMPPASSSAVITINVNDVNEAPNAVADSYSTDEDVVLNVPAPGVLANDSDPDGNALTAVLDSGVSNGSLTLNADGSFSYTPDAGYNGMDSFSYHVSDGILSSATVAVSIAVAVVNDAPVAAADGFSTDEDTPLNVAAAGVLANDSDPDGDPLTAVLDGGASNGSVVLNADGSFSYTPNADFNGSDSFSYHANDGFIDSATVVVSLTVNPVNDAPVAVADNFAGTEDTPLSVPAPGVLLNDSDVEGNPLSAVLDTDVGNGTLVLNADGSFTYTPDADFNGSDSFSYHANDGAADSSPATVTITVGPVNDGPTAVDDAFATDEDSVLNVPMPGVLGNDTDPDSDALTVTAFDAVSAQGATVSVNADGSFSYDPTAAAALQALAAGGSVADSFSYSIQDPGGDSDSATVTVTVSGVDDPPTAVDDAATVTEDDPATAINVLANDTDIDGGSSAIQTAAQPTNGTVVIVGGGTGLTYQPDPDYCNDPPGGTPDSFTYTLNGGSMATVSVTVTCVNDPPVVGPPASFNVTGNVRIQVPDGASDLLAGASDPEGTTLSIGGTVPTTTVQGGSLSISPATGSFSYNPPAGFEGADSFSYDVCDADGACTTTSANLTVNDMVWFVNPAAAAGDGRLATPFNSIAALNTANGGASGPAASEDIFLYSGGHSGSLTLLAGQRLFGQGATPSLTTLTGISLPAFSDAFPATGGARPNWTASNATALTLATNNVLRGFNIADTGTGTGIAGASFGTLTVDEMDISGSGQALSLDTGVMAGAGFGSVSSTSSAAQGIRLNAVTGSVALGGGSIAGSTGTAFQATGALGTVSYAGSVSKTSAGTLVDISGAGGGNVTLSGSMNCTASCSSGGGANGLRVSGRSGGTITFSGANKLFRPDIVVTNTQVLVSGNVATSVVFAGATGVGSSVTPVRGTAYLFGGGSFSLNAEISAVVADARAFDVDAATLAGSMTGSLVSDGALGIGVPAIEITNSAAPAGVTFAQSLTLDHDDAGESGGGLRLVGNTGSYLFPNAPQISSTNTAAVALDNAGSVGIGSVTAGAAVNDGGTAIDVSNTMIAPSGMTFARVQSIGAANGIVLNNTGNVGAFTVTGDGPNGTDGSGGTIQNISQRGISITNASNITLRNIDLNNVATADAANVVCDGLVNSGCHAGIHLSGATSVVLDNIDLNGSGEIGINGVTVSGLTLENSDIRNCGNEVNEGCLQVFGLSGTSAISNSTIALPSERAAYVNNNNAANLVLTVIDSTFSDTQSSGTGADGLELNFMGSSTATVDIIDSFFRRNRTNGLQVLAQGTSAVGVDITGSTFDREAGIGIGMDLAASDSAGLDFNVIGNPLINSRGGPAVNVFATGSAVIEGRIQNNPGIVGGGAGSSGDGIRVNLNETAQGTVLIEGNTVSGIGFDSAIAAMARLRVGGACGTGCTAGRLDVTINNNTTSVDATGLYDVWVQANDDNTTCANVTNNGASGAAIAAFRERTNAANSTVILQDFSTDAATTWNNNGNLPANSVSSSNNGTLQGGTCSTPGNPMP